MRLDTEILISIFAIIINGALWVIVHFSKIHNRSKRAFRVFILALLTYSIISLVIQLRPPNLQAWLKLIAASGIFSLMGIIYLVQELLGKKRAWVNTIYLYEMLAVLICILTDWMIPSASLDGTGKTHYVYSGFFILAAGPVYALTLTSLSELIAAYQEATDLMEINQIKYLIASVGIMSGLCILCLAELGRFPLHVAGNAVAAAVIAFALLKHQLPDIEKIIRKSLAYMVPAVIFGVVTYIMIQIIPKSNQENSEITYLLISVLMAVFAAIIIQPLSEKVQLGVDRLLFSDNLNSSLMLKRISRAAATYLEIKPLANMILSEIQSLLRNENGALFLIDKSSQEYRLIAQRGLDKNANLRIESDHPLIQWLEGCDDVLNRHDCEGFSESQSISANDRELMERIHAELYIPLRSQNNLTGFLSVGHKFNDLPYTHDNQATLITLANQSVVAFENARLYSQERTRISELNALYSLSRSLIATDAMQTVLDQIVIHAIESIHSTYASLILRHDNGIYTCQASHSLDPDYENIAGKIENSFLFPYYDQVLKDGQAVVVSHDRTDLADGVLQYLLPENFQSICLCPLRIRETPIGLLVLAERRNLLRESFDFDKLRLTAAISEQASNAIQRARLHEQLEDSFIQTIVALANALGAKDGYSNSHGKNLVDLAITTANKLNCTADDIQSIRWAMQLHDIGKIGIPNEILKKPGPLTEEEWGVMRQHPEIGAQIIAPVKRLKSAAPLIRSHHERYDGSGYPGRLRKENIPLGARIIAIVDTYGAITDQRVYRKARSHAEALQEISRCTGSQFDPQVSRAFMETMGEFHLTIMPQKEIENIAN